MQRAALLAHEDVADLLLLEQLVVDRQHGAAGIAEDVLDTLIGERLDDDLGAGHRACHGLSARTICAPERDYAMQKRCTLGGTDWRVKAYELIKR